MKNVLTKFSYMAIEYLGPNLEQLLQIMPEKKFSLKTVLMVAYEIT